MAENEHDTERSDETRKSDAEDPKTRKSKTKPDKTRKSEAKTNEKRKSQKKAKRKSRYALTKRTKIAIAVLAAVVVGLTAWLLWPGNDITEQLPAPPSQRPIIGGRGTLLTPENSSKMKEQFDGPLQDAHYTFSMTTEWEFDTWQTPSRNASVDNLERNTRTVYFDVILRDTEEVVYTSPYILLGGTLDNFALDKELPAGEHDAIATFFLVDDDFEYVTDVQITVKLIING